MDAIIADEARREWWNKHENFRQRIERLTNVWPPQASDDQKIEGLRATTRAFQSLIAEAEATGRPLRGLGGGWSMSKVAATGGRLVNTKPLNWIFYLEGEGVSPAYRGDPAGLLFAQCGSGIGEIHAYLRKRGRSLRTCGASNGQTIVGAVSTGTHGSAFDVGSLADAVVAIHLVPDARRHLWLERASQPVVSDALAAALGAKLVRDDELFDAAVIGLGSFGLVHAVVLETDPLFLVEATRARMALDSGLRRTITTLDFDALPLPDAPQRPYHFEVVINPHEDDPRPLVTSMYRRPYHDHYPREDDPALGIGDDALCAIGRMTDLINAFVPAVVGFALQRTYPEFKGKTGTLGEIFSNTTTRGTAVAMSMGIALADAERVVDLLIGLNRSDGPFPGVIALRFVKRSRATLAFQRFDPTAVIELDGYQSALTSAFHVKVWRALDAQGIPFTLHWGKANGYLTPVRVRRMYGHDAARWKAARRRLLSPTTLTLFSNAFLNGCGLGD